jgi:hypothetical protein
MRTRPRGTRALVGHRSARELRACVGAYSSRERFLPIVCSLFAPPGDSDFFCTRVVRAAAVLYNKRREGIHNVHKWLTLHSHNPPTSPSSNPTARSHRKDSHPQNFRTAGQPAAPNNNNKNKTTDQPTQFTYQPTADLVPTSAPEKNLEKSESKLQGNQQRQDKGQTGGTAPRQGHTTEIDGNQVVVVVVAHHQCSAERLRLRLGCPMILIFC